jgi:hypothetical protein
VITAQQSPTTGPQPASVLASAVLAVVMRVAGPVPTHIHPHAVGHPEQQVSARIGDAVVYLTELAVAGRIRQKVGRRAIPRLPAAARAGFPDLARTDTRDLPRRRCAAADRRRRDHHPVDPGSPRNSDSAIFKGPRGSAGMADLRPPSLAEHRPSLVRRPTNPHRVAVKPPPASPFPTPRPMTGPSPTSARRPPPPTAPAERPPTPPPGPPPCAPAAPHCSPANWTPSRSPPATSTAVPSTPQPATPTATSPPRGSPPRWSTCTKPPPPPNSPTNSPSHRHRCNALRSDGDRT